MADYSKTAQLLAAVARIAGTKGTSSKEGVRFRVVVRSADDERVGVTVQVNDHGREVKGYQLGQIGRKLCLDRKALVDALDNWGPDELRAHLEAMTKAELLAGRAR